MIYMIDTSSPIVSETSRSTVHACQHIPSYLVRAALILALGSLLAGCLFFPPSTPPTTPTELTSAPSVSPPTLQTSAPTSDTLAVDAPTPRVPQQLAVWISDEVGPLAEGGSFDVLQRQVIAFEATHPGLTIEVSIKGAEGPGAIDRLLTTASAVAPSIVPDLVALNTAKLDRLARQGLTVPLEGLISQGVQQDLYDLALEAATVDDQWMGIQFQAKGLEHAIYNPNKIAVPPLTWAEVYSSGATYIFPAAGQDGLVNDAFLVQYLSMGASLVDSSGNPALDQDALAEVLEFYRQGIERGAILSDVVEYATVEQTWPRFLQAEVTISDISSDLYLSVKTGEATAVPTRDGQATILSRGHAWAITTHDPDRQVVVVKLLDWLLNPINMATWSQAAGTLPTRRAALAEMDRGPYVTFMYSQLETAHPFPISETHLRIYRAMQLAVNAVLREGISPESAAENVLKAVNQETSG
jgi:ABC-type glycerol-3-phosphate transport system substrate-binding protein